MVSTELFDLVNKPKIFIWPPEIASITALGYVREASGNYYPRDIGRSSVLSNRQIIWQFGDTFSHDQSRKFLGVSSNTCALSQQFYDIVSPTITRYARQYVDDTRMITREYDGEGLVSNLIEKGTDEEDTTAMRWKIWCFSGIVERSNWYGNIRGWCFYEMWKDEMHPGGRWGLFDYTGIAEVWSSHPGLSARACENPQRGRRLFDTDEPRFGSFCAIAEREMVYLYGHIGGNNRTVVLARAPLSSASHRDTYTYWTGAYWSEILDTHSLQPIFTDMQHGQIFCTNLFGIYSPYRYAFVGCNAYGDSKVQFGRARNLEGPWEVVQLNDVELYALNGKELKEDLDFKYCVYAHPWACDQEKGDLMISWSEGGLTGGVLAAIIRFKSI